MNAYSVRCIPPGPLNGFRAEVDGPGHVRGIGYEYSERAAIAAAWRDYWRAQRWYPTHRRMEPQHHLWHPPARALPAHCKGRAIQPGTVNAGCPHCEHGRTPPPFRVSTPQQKGGGK